MLSVIILLCFSVLSSGEGVKAKFLDVGDGQAMKEVYSPEGVLETTIPYDKKTGRPHGEMKWYDKEGNVIRSQWYVFGKESDKEAFLRAEEQRKIKPQYSEIEQREGDRINGFIKNLSTAWSKQNYTYCKSLIEKVLTEDSDWVPGLVANFTYLLYVDSDMEKSLNVLKSIEDLIKNEDSNTIKSVEAQRILMSVVSNYANLVKRAMEAGNKIERGKVVFPEGVIIILYGRSKGYAVDSMADLRLEFEKKNLQK